MKSIRIKLWAGMMILVVVMLILLWLFQIVFLEKFYTDMRVKEIKNAGYSIINELENNNIQGIGDKLDLFTYNNNLSLEIIDATGNTIYKSTGMNNNFSMMMHHNMHQENFKKIIIGEEIAILQTHPRFGNKFMQIGLPIQISGNIQGALYINMPLAPVEDTALILKKQFLYISIILFLVALILSFIIANNFLKPILKIKKTAKKMASGDFSDRIISYSQDEIGQLAETINYMGQELAKIEELRKELIANMSHELRTPLSIIRGYAETIRDITGNTPVKREKHLEIIIEESERLSKMVDDILNLSQMQAGYLDLNLQKTSLNYLLNRILNKYELLSEKTGITISAHCPAKLDLIIDETRIEQVFYNLINNAFNHTNENGQISILVANYNDFIRIEIKDTGEGISEQNLVHIWDRYYKGDKTNEAKMAGTGLGLAIVKNILEAHHALYGVTSKKGEGTTFWFELKNKNL
ncbi:Signal transduction histidine kinase [Desulfonispora thiosulfatigenes DSM 11270]|uniref:histidine kinase n=1 Tax=Desulfonispora thiosulfatigenes DSM 11270 TaxID=656914 RepID=A0A1W1UE14_DESTI|nr:ATP-binding protein [Desulfonispora thiosulfatigenes]SMB79061.1 Signal transduction histidine kinase [Desulfonispora thiosulfatigenes DSM 11270]